MFDLSPSAKADVSNMSDAGNRPVYEAQVPGPLTAAMLSLDLFLVTRGPLSCPLSSGGSEGLRPQAPGPTGPSGDIKVAALTQPRPLPSGWTRLPKAAWTSAFFKKSQKHVFEWNAAMFKCL